MFKKVISLLLIVVACLSFVSPPNSKFVSNAVSDPYMGDVNGDGLVDEADLTLLKAYLDGNASEIRYEFCDLDGNYKVDTLDADILDKYLRGKVSALTGTPFGKPDHDISDELQDLGINNFKKWGNSDIKYIISRNPYDMITSNGLVMVSGGNYQSNTGPVYINGYGKGTNDPINMGKLATEQVNKFYDFGDFIVALAIDARTWQYGDVYLKPAISNEWVTLPKVLVGNIHCYDIVEFDGKYFFCGSNIVYKELNGEEECQELVQPEIQMAWR